MAANNMEELVRKVMDVEDVVDLGASSGGCINQGNTYQTEKGKVFIKMNIKSESERMFVGEYEGLQEIIKTKTVKVPKPIKVCDHPSGSGSVLFLEHLQMRELGHCQERLGKEIGKMHLHNLNKLDKDENEASRVGTEGDAIEKFGFHCVSCCGYLPLDNTWSGNWVEFYCRQRLQTQLDMIEKEFCDREAVELWPALQRKIPQYFKGVVVKPSLLHGDLWGGNAAELGNVPVVYDPAAFYGHHEFDLAIATIFGGFSGAFFNAYHKYIPKSPGFDKRLKLYQLFHYLNHWNHFGKGYRTESIAIMKSLSS